MRLYGTNIKGYKYIGKPTLGTIGTQLFWYDYRFNYDPLSTDTTRLSNWRSLAIQGTPLNYSTNRLYIYSDGFGYLNGASGAPFVQGTPYTALNQFHLGVNPWLISFVLRVDYTSANGSSTINFLNTKQSGSFPGLSIGADPVSTGRLRLQVFNNAGSGIVNFNPAAGSLPLGEFIHVTCLWYGDASANNYKIISKATTYTATSTPTYGTNNATLFRVGLPVIAVNDFKLKSMVAYDLTGKNRTQIDAFTTLYLTTLKLDSEYSSIVTP